MRIQLRVVQVHTGCGVASKVNPDSRDLPNEWTCRDVTLDQFITYCGQMHLANQWDIRSPKKPKQLKIIQWSGF